MPQLKRKRNATERKEIIFQGKQRYLLLLRLARSLGSSANRKCALLLAKCVKMKVKILVEETPLRSPFVRLPLLVDNCQD